MPQQHRMMFVVVQKDQLTAAFSDGLLSCRTDGRLFHTMGVWNAKLLCPVTFLMMKVAYERI